MNRYRLPLTPELRARYPVNRYREYMFSVEPGTEGRTMDRSDWTDEDALEGAVPTPAELIDLLRTYGGEPASLVAALPVVADERVEYVWSDDPHALDILNMHVLAGEWPLVGFLVLDESGEASARVFEEFADSQTVEGFRDLLGPFEDEARLRAAGA